MKREIFRGLLTILLYYTVDWLTKALLVMPDNPLVNVANFLPPLLGLMWGPAAAVGSLIGALIAEYTDWLVLPEIWRTEGLAACLFEGFLLFCNCGFWAFVDAYLPWRLWHSILVDPDEPLFALRPKTILKLVLILCITVVTTSLFCTMCADEAYTLRYIGSAAKLFGSIGGYALVCFSNDFSMPVFFGLVAFFFLAGREYPFVRPAPAAKARPHLARAFDALWVFSVALTVPLCQPSMLERDGLRLASGLLLCAYIFRPLAPPPRELAPEERAGLADGIHTERTLAALFYGFLLLLFLVLDTSGVIYGLDTIDTWLQFVLECQTMMNVAIVALLYMLLKYRRSIMTKLAILEIVAVFVSALALGGVGVFIVNRVTTRNVENELAKMTVICRERLKRTFDGIQVSVESFRNLARAELGSYGRLAGDEPYRAAYLHRMETLFHAIASNTEGSIAFYFRCNPAFAGPQGGFSFGRLAGRREVASADFYRRRPIDLSKYAPSDTENVGWYYLPVMRRSATWIDPYIDPTTSAYVISYVIPIFEEENLVGVVGMDVDIGYLSYEVRRMSIYGHGQVYLTDRQGRVLYHKGYSQGEAFGPDAERRETETYLTNGIRMGISIPKRAIYAERNNLLMHLVCATLAVAILVSALSLFFASRGIRPLLALTGAAQKIAGGNLDVRLPAESRDELGTLVRSIRDMVAKLEVYVYRDNLTGLLNPAAHARKRAELSRRGADDAPYAVAVFDVNFLKKVNDACGHEAGNELLRCVAGVMADVFGQNAVYRTGGDEFTAIFEGVAQERGAELMERFDAALAAQHFQVQGTEFPLSVAHGLAVWRQGMDYADVFQEADDAMYADKAATKQKWGEDVR